jgi:tRNA 2-thiouridine synthesizing protein A
VSARNGETETLDLTGLKCPMPALLARKRLAAAAAGARFVVLTDDPMAPVDVPHMCHENGFEVVSVEREGDCARMVLRRP